MIGMQASVGGKSAFRKVIIAASALLLIFFGVWFDGRRPPDAERPTASDKPLYGPARPGSGSGDVRPEAAAGTFYPADPGELRALVDALFAAAPAAPVAGRARIILAPHAGYDYSGPVAAAAFKALAGSGYERVIIIGNSHHTRFDGVRADGHDTWNTPLGPVAVDREFIGRLTAAAAAVGVDPAPHDPEHSLEVMVPLLVGVLGPDVKIVPLLFGSGGGAAADDLAAALRPLLDDRTAVVISSDLAHYPRYEDANILDGATVRAVLSGDPDVFRARFASSSDGAVPPPETLACAGIAIESGLVLARAMGLAPRLLQYANSGDRPSGSKDRVVGYAAVAFNEPLPPPARELDPAEQAEALAIARQALVGAFAGADRAPAAGTAVFGEKRGVFVTLKKGGQLRGCIGVFETDRPLAESIWDMARAAAFDDGRFQPLTAAELPEIEIEVSVLSPLVRVAGAAEIEVGRHGVYLRRGGSSGVFLPQVAAEQGWDKAEFLTALCRDKAGLAGDCWQDPRTELRVFTAQVF